MEVAVDVTVPGPLLTERGELSFLGRRPLPLPLRGRAALGHGGGGAEEPWRTLPTTRNARMAAITSHVASVDSKLMHMASPGRLWEFGPPCNAQLTWRW